MPTTTPCLWFDGRAEEAAELYTGLFPNSRITHVQRYGAGEHGQEGTVLTVAFELDGRPFVALNGGPEFAFTEAVSFQIDCADQAEVDRYWEALMEGGGEPGRCGWLKDRFGLSWQIVPRQLGEMLGDPDRARAGRAMEAMLKMNKIDVAALRRAFEGEPGA